MNDAQILLKAGRFDGAVYVCGYAVELALKARICKTLGWAGFPETSREFEDYRSFRTHDLEVLLTLTSIEDLITTRYGGYWSSVTFWNPELRYSRVGYASVPVAAAMIRAAQVLMRYLMR